MIVTDPAVLRRETEIVWLDPHARDLPFLRERIDVRQQVSGHEPRFRETDNVVAYARIRKLERSERDVPAHRGFRVWTIRHDDVTGYADPDGVVRRAPGEGVVPSSILPGQVSAAAGLALTTKAKTTTR